MTAQRGDFERPPAPDPRFRDKLAEALIVWWAESGGVDIGEVRAVNDGAAQAYADVLMPLFAAELARVQAAANQRTAEVGEVLDYAQDEVDAAPESDHAIGMAEVIDRVRAALAQPAQGNAG